MIVRFNGSNYEGFIDRKYEVFNGVVFVYTYDSNNMIALLIAIVRRFDGDS